MQVVGVQNILISFFLIVKNLYEGKSIRLKINHILVVLLSRSNRHTYSAKM